MTVSNPIRPALRAGRAHAHKLIRHARQLMPNQPAQQADESTAHRAPLGGVLTEGFFKLLEDEVQQAIDEGRDADRIIEKLTEADVVMPMIDAAAEPIHAALARAVPELSAGLDRDERAVRRELKGVWGDADGLYRAVTQLAVEIGSGVADSLPKQTVKMTTMLRINARATRVASEVRLLAMNGFDSGSDARWRTLLDLSVVAHIIADNPVEIAERYEAYAAVESYQDIQTYQQHAEALGDSPLDEDTVRASTDAYEAVIARWGPSLRKPNGWAAPLFPTATSKSQIQFSALQDLAGLAHMKPYYKLANHPVHVGPRASHLETRFDGPGRPAVNAGATVRSDIAETCHGAMISLHQVTGCLARAYLDDEDSSGIFDVLVGLKAQALFVNEARDAWSAAADEARRRGWFAHSTDGGSPAHAPPDDV